MTKSYTLHDLPSSERPRERLVRFGPDALSGQELLALILGRGVKGESVMVTSQKLLSHFGSIKGIAHASLEDLQQVKGIGLAKAAQIKASFEVSKRLLQHEYEENLKGKISLSKPEAVAKLVHSRIKDYNKEHLFVISLDTRNNFLGIDEVAVGTLNASLVHPRETFLVAINRHAASIIIAHNHPSGDPEPSDEDVKITHLLKQSGRILDIELMDHLVVTKNNFISFKSKRLF